MALQGGKTKSNKSKPSLWSLLVKKPGNGSGDGHVFGSHSVYDRRHHIMQLQLISPLLFDTPYSHEKMCKWFEGMKFVDSASITESDFNAKLATQAFKEAYLFVEVYNDYLSLASETAWNTVKSAENKHPSLDLVLTEMWSFNWFEEICHSYRNVYTSSTPNQIATALLIAIFHYHTCEASGEDIVQVYEEQCAENLETCKNYHTKGNDNFKNESFEQALANYSKGLKLHPYHEVLYSNRSQTYLKLLKYKEAEFDARRAVCLKCDRPKSYHRLVESVEKQGNLHQALELATEGMELCEETVSPDDRMALTELIASLKNKLNLSSGDSSEGNTTNTIRLALDRDESHNIVRMSIITTGPDTNAMGLPELLSTDSESEGFPPFSGIANVPPKPKKLKKVPLKPRTSDVATSMPDVPSVPQEAPKTAAQPPTIQRQRSVSETRVSLLEFKANVADASVALLAQQCRQASYFYGKALKDLSCLDGQLSEKEIVLIKYASAIAFSNSGVYTDMLKALSLFQEIIDNHKKVQFPLTYYGMARCYHKQNRFKEALIAIYKCLEAVDLKPIDCKLTWPGTGVVIVEENEGLKAELQKLEETCKNPPRPDALCRYDKGDHVKSEIYLSDPDFKGYIKVTCLERCILHYHPNCWKSLKEELLQTNDKEFLGKECLTPDCESSITEINHIGNDGEVAKKFVHPSENTTRTGTKQKRSKLEKKLQAKKQKKTQKTAAEPVVDQMDSLQSEPADANEDKELDVDLEDGDKDGHVPGHNKDVPVHNKEHSTALVPVPVDVPEKHPHPSSAKTGTSKAPVGMGTALMLKKDDKQIIQSKAPSHRSERHRKKDKRNKILTIDEFLGTHPGADSGTEVAFVNNYVKRLSKLNAQRNRVEQGKTVRCISPNTIINLDQEEPFHIPEHLRQDYEEVQRMVLSSSLVEESATTRAIKENFISYMKDFMKGTGALHLEDPRLLEEIANLPIELQELICNAGGFREFMVKSQQFIVLQDRIYCLDYTPRDTDVGSQFFDLTKPSASIGEQNSLRGKPSKGKVDSLDSFDVESIAEQEKQVCVSAVAKHESSSESEVSDSDLTYDESEKTGESGSILSKEPETDDFSDVHVTPGRIEREDEDEDDESSDYSDDEYESDHSEKNVTIVEKQSPGSLLPDNKIDAQNILLSALNSVQVRKAASGSASPANIEHPVLTARSGSVDSTSSSSCDISISGERPNAMDFSRRRYLDKFLQFVPRFSEKGQGQVLCLLLRIIQNEDILHKHMKDTSGFPVEALENTIRNLTLAAGVLHPVSNKAVQTMPNEDEIRVKIDNARYQEEISKLKLTVQQLEMSNRATESTNQERSTALQKLNQELVSSRRQLATTQERLDSVVRSKTTAEKKLEEMQASLDKFKADLEGERRLRIQAHDLSRRLQSDLATLQSAHEKLLTSGNPPTLMPEQRNGDPRPSLMSLKIQPPIPMATGMMPWSSLTPSPSGYLPMPSGSNLTGRPLVAATPVTAATVSGPPKVHPATAAFTTAVAAAAAAKNLSLSFGATPKNETLNRAASSLTNDVVASKSMPNSSNTVKQLGAGSRVALDDFDDGRNASAPLTARPASSGPPIKTCKSSNSEPEMKTPLNSPSQSSSRPPFVVQPSFIVPSSSTAKNSFEKLMIALQPEFPNCSRSELRMMVQSLRARRNNSLTGIGMQQIIQELHKMREKPKAPGATAKSASARAPFCSTSMGLDRIAEPGVAWQCAPPEKRNWEVNQTEEDPCIICHEEMEGTDICQLQCLHRFHLHCIRQWFREQSTCPTCRVHSILPDEFPPLA